jgi:ABC-type multidrug transport system permease subunit
MCGFLIPAAAIPGWWIWCYWINPIAYTLYGESASKQRGV